MKTMVATIAWIVFALVVVDGRADNALDARLKTLENELRCLVCQNQTLAESNAPLAEDLRKEVRSLAVAGKSDDDIRAYLVARYGDFVLYNPPVKPTTYALWLGPFLLLAAGIVIWLRILRRRAALPADVDEAAAPAPETARARALLDGTLGSEQ
ncbi:MAG TPA: cytochrome c-type biogenesis protein [Casimicrobiaceae bacterium]|nr:cytochrome c-type biogenesis protein [Casimicrobiaceae bacterium]